MSNKTITMTVHQGNTCVTIQETFSDAATWGALAYQFQKFLAAQGYLVSSEDVGADVDDYCASIDVESEEW